MVRAREQVRRRRGSMADTCRSSRRKGRFWREGNGRDVERTAAGAVWGGSGGNHAALSRNTQEPAACDVAASVGIAAVATIELALGLRRFSIISQRPTTPVGAAYRLGTCLDAHVDWLSVTERNCGDQENHGEHRAGDEIL